MDQLLAALSAYIGAAHVLTGTDAAPYCRDWRNMFQGAARAVVRPADTAQVAQCVALCGQAGVALVPQGGNTGLSGGATPSDGQIVLSLGRLNHIHAVDPLDMTLIAQAGVTLQAAQDAATRQGLMLPLRIASQGSAQLGGVLAANAGGHLTLRYGNARALMLGLEVVLADGRVWNGLRCLRKDNTGYALNQIFVGSEGTLGVITAVCLQLAPACPVREVALVALPSVEAALSLLGAMKAAAQDALHAFEYIARAALEMLIEQIDGAADPFAAPALHYVLIELAGAARDVRERLESGLEAAMAHGWVLDAVIAGSDAQRAALWRLREELTEAQRRSGVNIKNDIAVPVASVPAFLENAGSACRAIAPALRIVPFGHLGDGNIHFNLVAPGSLPVTPELTAALMHAVNEAARALNGSFSAEHGIGQLKTALLAEWRGGVELDLMARLKAAFDPACIMNPGKVLAH